MEGTPLTSGTPDSASQQTPVAPPQPQTPPVPVSVPTDKPVTQAAGATPKVNLHELPEFRQVQSQYERQLAEERRKRQELEMRGMDDFEKLQYTNQQLTEQLGQYQQLVQEAQQAQQRQQALLDISTVTGAPVNVLNDATDPDDAWRRAVQYMRTAQQPQAQQAQQAPAQAGGNPWAQPMQVPQQVQQWQPDLGGGQASTARSRLEQEVAKAQQDNDPYAYVRALRRLQSEG